MSKEFEVEIIGSDKEDAEERLFRAFEYLLNIDDVTIINIQKKNNYFSTEFKELQNFL